MRDEVDIPTVRALQREWRRNPPVNQLVAAYLQYKPPPEPGPPRLTSAAADPDIEDLLLHVGHVPIRRYEPIDTTAFDEAMAAKAARENQEK